MRRVWCAGLILAANLAGCASHQAEETTAAFAVSHARAEIRMALLDIENAQMQQEIARRDHRRVDQAELAKAQAELQAAKEDQQRAEQRAHELHLKVPDENGTLVQY